MLSDHGVLKGINMLCAFWQFPHTAWVIDAMFRGGSMSLCNKHHITKLQQQENVLSRLEPPTGSHHFTTNRRFLVRLTLWSWWILPRRVVREKTAGAQRNFWAHCASLRGSWPLFASCFVVARTTQEESTGFSRSSKRASTHPSKCCSLKEKNLFIPLLPGPLSSRHDCVLLPVWKRDDSVCVCPSLTHHLKPDFLLIFAALKRICWLTWPTLICSCSLLLHR